MPSSPLHFLKKNWHPLDIPPDNPRHPTRHPLDIRQIPPRHPSRYPLDTPQIPSDIHQTFPKYPLNIPHISTRRPPDTLQTPPPLPTHQFHHHQSSKNITIAVYQIISANFFSLQNEGAKGRLKLFQKSSVFSLHHFKSKVSSIVIFGQICGIRLG